MSDCERQEENREFIHRIEKYKVNVYVKLNCRLKVILGKAHFKKGKNIQGARCNRSDEPTGE